MCGKHDGRKIYRLWFLVPTFLFEIAFLSTLRAVFGKETRAMTSTSGCKHNNNTGNLIFTFNNTSEYFFLQFFSLILVKT